MKVFLKAFSNVCKSYWPIALRIGYKAGIISAMGCALLAIGEPEASLKIFGYLFWGIVANVALIIFIPFISILVRRKARAMARVRVDFQKEWEKVWDSSSSDPVDWLFP